MSDATKHLQEQGPSKLGQQARFYPLERVRLGVWESRLHLDGQLFAMVLPAKFVYVVVHPARELSSPTHNQKLFIENLNISELSWQKQKKQILSLPGKRNPFTTCDGDKVDFYGVVTFELEHADVGGMECTNSLIHNFSRLVFEAKTLRKKAFVTVEDFFVHYELEQDPPRNLHYVPAFNRKDNKIDVRTCWQTMQEFDMEKVASSNDVVDQSNKKEQRASKFDDMLFNKLDETSNLERRDTKLANHKRHLSSSILTAPLKEDSHQNQAERKQDCEVKADLISIASQDNLLHCEPKCQLIPASKRRNASLGQIHHSSQQGSKRLALDGGSACEEQSEQEHNELPQCSMFEPINGASGGLQGKIGSDQTCMDSSQRVMPANVSKSEAQRAAQGRGQGEEEVEKGKPVNEMVLKEMTIIAFHEDAGFQQALKELLYKPENKELLLKYEQSLPSWTVVLAQYTGKYRPWMRHTVRVVCFIASCITLSIACYDLYKNFPLLRGFLDKYFKETTQWLEEILHDQVAAIMACILYVAWPLQFVYDTLKQSETFLQMISLSTYPFVVVFQQLVALLWLIWDLVWPIKALISFILRTSWSLVWNILCLPYTILYFFYSTCLNSVAFLQSFKNSFGSVQRIAEQAPSTSDTQEAFSMIAYGTQLCIQWSQSLANKVLRAFKAVYDFIVYVGCEIGKHNYTIQVYLWERWTAWYEALCQKFTQMLTLRRRTLFLKALKMLLYGFVAIFLCNILVVFFRERYALEGCVLCIEKEVGKIQRMWASSHSSLNDEGDLHCYDSDKPFNYFPKLYY